MLQILALFSPPWSGFLKALDNTEVKISVTAPCGQPSGPVTTETPGLIFYCYCFVTVHVFLYAMLEQPRTAGSSAEDLVVRLCCCFSAFVLSR